MKCRQPSSLGLLFSFHHDSGTGFHLEVDVMCVMIKWRYRIFHNGFNVSASVIEDTMKAVNTFSVMTHKASQQLIHNNEEHNAMKRRAGGVNDTGQQQQHQYLVVPSWSDTPARQSGDSDMSCPVLPPSWHLSLCSRSPHLCHLEARHNIKKSGI